MSTTSIIMFGVIIVVVIAVVWKWWKKPDSSKKNEEISHAVVQTNMEEGVKAAEDAHAITPASPPPMVFAINDDGYLDLSDMNGKMLDSKFSPNPKTYIGLLDAASKDITELKTDEGTTFKSNVGNTKLYQVAGNSYIINYTRL